MCISANVQRSRALAGLGTAAARVQHTVLRADARMGLGHGTARHAKGEDNGRDKGGEDGEAHVGWVIRPVA
jgi:hypothetical protein